MFFGFLRSNFFPFLDMQTIRIPFLIAFLSKGCYRKALGSGTEDLCNECMEDFYPEILDSGVCAIPKLTPYILPCCSLTRWVHLDKCCGTKKLEFPRCHDDGYFKPKQRYIHSGYCYCVDKLGTELEKGEQCCPDIDICASYPCQHGGTCNNLENNYKCKCKAGFTGANCETDIDECESYPCQNGATCNNLKNNYKCICKAGFTGANCETGKLDPCLNRAKGGKATALSQHDSNNSASSGFDGPGKYWHSAEGMPQWLMYELKDPLPIDKISWKTRYQTDDHYMSIHDRDCPKSFVFEGSNDAKTFTPLLSVKDLDVHTECKPKRTMTKCFHNNKLFKYYRFTVTDVKGRTNGKKWAVISDLQFFSDNDNDECESYSCQNATTIINANKKLDSLKPTLRQSWNRNLSASKEGKLSHRRTE